MALDVTKLDLERGKLDPTSDNLKVVKGGLVDAEGVIFTTLVEGRLTVKSNGDLSRS